MAKILIVYASKNGQSEKIAHFMAEQLRPRGHSVDLFHCGQQPDIIELKLYDAVIVGGPVYAHGFPHSLVQWTAAHAAELQRKAASFFSVCLGILQTDVKVQEDEKQIVVQFFNKTGWHPRRWTIFAGGLPYTKYNWFIRFFMKRIAAKAGGDTDTTKDFEYTNWAEVKRFALESAAMAHQQENRQEL